MDGKKLLENMLNHFLNENNRLLEALRWELDDMDAPDVLGQRIPDPPETTIGKKAQ